MKVSNLSQEIELYIAPLEKPHLKQPQIFFVKPSDNGTMRFHKIVFLGPEYAIFIRIVPLSNVTLTLYVRYGERPTLEHSDFSSSILNNRSRNFSLEKNSANCSKDPFTITLSATVTGHTGVHYVGILIGEHVNEINNNGTSPDHVRRVRRGCLRKGRQKRSCVGVKDPPTTAPRKILIKPPFNSSADVNYTLSVSMATCQYWNVTAAAWSTEGCRVCLRHL